MLAADRLDVRQKLSCVLSIRGWSECDNGMQFYSVNSRRALNNGQITQTHCILAERDCYRPFNMEAVHGTVRSRPCSPKVDQQLTSQCQGQAYRKLQSPGTYDPGSSITVRKTHEMNFSEDGNGSYGIFVFADGEVDLCPRGAVLMTKLIERMWLCQIIVILGNVDLL